MGKAGGGGGSGGDSEMPKKLNAKEINYQRNPFSSPRRQHADVNICTEECAPGTGAALQVGSAAPQPGLAMLHPLGGSCWCGDCCESLFSSY